MASKYLLYLVSILHCIFCSCERIQANKVYCVTSTTNTTLGCQGYDLIIENNTLTHYLTHSSKYFNSYETYVFQDGNHTLLSSFNVQFQGITNLTLTGPVKNKLSKKAIIDCNGTATSFHFNNSLNIIIENLTFTSCIRKHDIALNGSKHEKGLVILTFRNGINISLLGVTLLGSVDAAFFIGDTTGNITIDNVVVANSNPARRALRICGSSVAFNNYHNNITSYLSLTNSIFINNTNFVQEMPLLAAGGLTLDIKSPNVTVKIFNLTMSNNTGYHGGNLAVYMSPNALHSSIEIANSTFEGGRAAKGAGVYMSVEAMKLKIGECKDNCFQHKLLHIYNTRFTNNIAEHYGGGIFIEQIESLTNFNHTIIMNQLIFEQVTFAKNSLHLTKKNSGGIALHSLIVTVTGYIYHGNPQFQVILNNCSIHHNYIKLGDIDSISTIGVVFTKSNHFFKITNTAICCNKATGILGMSSNLVLSKNVTISNNNGSLGGGMLLCQNAVMYLEVHTNVTIAHNRAISLGGGISVETYYLESEPICFFQLGRESAKNISLIETTSVTIYNNSAGFAGNNIFGGSINVCYVHQFVGKSHNKSFKLNILIFNKVFNIPNNTVDFSSISSPPHKLCLCQNKKPDCKIKSFFLPNKFPGETFVIEAVLVGQFDGTVPGTVQANLLSKHSSLKQGERVQKLSWTICNQLTYTIYTSSYHEVLQIRVLEIGGVNGFEDSVENTTKINIQFKNCPLGFTLTNADNFLWYCDCNWLLIQKKYAQQMSCNITTQTVERVPPVWIGNVETENGSKIVAVHKYCPFDYCLNTYVKLVSSNGSLSQDRQCAFNRTGVLCGSCSNGLSVAFGSSECQICSNYWIALLIPVALTGVAFLIILILFDITIADGTLSGIIFYCNIIGSNITTFFPAESEKDIPFLTTFIKHFILFINLNLGVSFCLFDGMNAYTKAWLGFVFPLYLWLITGVYIFLGGGRCSWIVRRNAVKVLATFVLLSYTRLLSAVAESLQVSVLQLETGGFELRWLIDGNIKYFEGKHIPLVIFAMILGLLLLPFALCLYFIQWLQKASDWKGFSWINHLKPFFDVYTGPFTASGRFWTGLLLISRVALLVTTAVNVTGSPNTILGAILLVVVILCLVTTLLPNGLYQQKCLNLLEYSSLVNLGALSFLFLISKYSLHISHIFVSIEIFIFIGVIVYHSSKNRFVQNSCCYRKLKKLGFGKKAGIKKLDNRNENDEVFIANFPHYAEDREPLLATNN